MAGMTAPLPATAPVLVTGCSSGIGRGIARALARAGMQVVISGRRQQQLDEATELLNADGLEVLAMRVDVTDLQTQAPTITSANATTFVVGQPNTFAMTTTGTKDATRAACKIRDRCGEARPRSTSPRIRCFAAGRTAGQSRSQIYISWYINCYRRQ